MAFLLVAATGSGLAALIYEIVWFQLLELAIGSTAVSLAVVLATFMGGICMGGLVLPRAIPARSNPLRVYAALELGIGALGLLALVLIPFAGRIYTEWSGLGMRGFLLRGAVAAVGLIPPTFLMGGTLPALARAIVSGRNRSSWLGWIYAANIAGAVCGCLISGFYLLPHYDVATATYVAVSVNAAMAAAGFVVSKLQPKTPETVGAREELPEPQSSGTRVQVAVALSGFCALAAESIWTRTLGLLFGSSVYALSIILAVFLFGMGAGAGAAALLNRAGVRARSGLVGCQFLVAPAIAWASYSMNGSLPYWPINPAISSSVRFNFELDLARACWTLLPATIFWGASFPFALAAIPNRDAGRVMGTTSASNTGGAILGALVASLVLIAWIGSQRADQVLIAVAIGAGLILMPRSGLIAALAIVTCGLLIYSVPPIPKLLIAYGRYAATWVAKTEVVYAREGINSSVAVSIFPNGARTFHVAGKIQASNVARDMRLQRMLGHLVTLTVGRPGSVLVIGCGAGITAGAVSIDSRVQRVTIAEIEPLVPQAASAYFREPNFDVIRGPKTQLRLDDGRHYVLTTRERFDGITVDPLDPWVKGAADLYTREFLAAMKQHLNPGGAVTMYVQLFETNLDAVKSALTTFFEVFPNATVWGNPYRGHGHDMVVLGQVEPLQIDLDEMEQRFGYQDEGSKIPQSLAEIGMNSPVDLFATFAGQRSDLTEWLRGAQINRDRNLRMQYLAGLGLNRDDAAEIYSSMLGYRKFPENIFWSAEGRVDSLKRAIQQANPD